MTGGNSNGPAIGIDLGSAYSRVSVFRHGKVEIIANDQGNRTTPSYVAFTDTERLVGDKAKSQFALNPTNTVYDAKRLIGRKFGDSAVQRDMEHWPFRVQEVDGRLKVTAECKNKEKLFAPEEISSMILSKMKDTAEAYLGEKVNRAVITVPAYFNDAQRQATKDAGAIAGLDVIGLINEPTAAALSYGLNKGQGGQMNILLFDLGAGTFDVSVIGIDEGSFFEVKATAGDMNLGGEDFDGQLVHYCVQEFKRVHQKDIAGNAKALQRLRTACESAKRLLSNDGEVSIKIDSLVEGIDYQTKVTRAKFVDLCEHLFHKTLFLVDKALKDAKLFKSEIDEVVLVGGSTRIPKVQQLLRDFFNDKELNNSLDAEEAVAYGAAVHAAVLAGDTSERVADVMVMDIIPRSLILEATGGGVMPVVNRGTVIPTEIKQKFSTFVDNQSEVTVEVFQGDHQTIKDNSLLGKFTLTGIPPAPRGVPEIQVYFNIDADNILNVTAKDRKTSNDINVKDDRDRLSQAEIGSMMHQS